MSAKVIGIIPARYASTRFPGKPLITIQGKTLLQRTFENASQATILDKILIATDDQRIFDHVTSFGGEALMTSPNWINGTERIAEVLHLYPEYLKADAIVNIQGDEPILDPQAIKDAVELLLQDPLASMATLATPLWDVEHAMNPACVKCVKDKQNNALYFSRALIPSNKNQCFQSETPYFQHIGLYVYRPSFLLDYQLLASTPLQLAEDLEQLKVLEYGYRIKVAVTNKTNIGIDTPDDLKKFEQWLCTQNTSS